MKRIGFIIEMAILVMVIGAFVITNAGWLKYASMDVFQEETMSGKADKKSDETTETKEEQVQEQPAEEVAAEPAEAEAPLEAESVDAEPAESEADPDSPAGRAAALGLPTPPDIDINSWEYILVNGENTIDGTFVPETGTAYCNSSATEQDIRIVDALNKFAAATEAQGLQVYLSSGYRDYYTQQYLFDLKCQDYDYETAATIVAIPGTSEHQTGLCCDITDYYREYKNSELEYTDTYQWMSTHCQEYGFIVRFPKGKEDITKIIYEPWHYRYVGVEAATYIMANDLTLEEFVALYK